MGIESESLSAYVLGKMMRIRNGSGYYNPTYWLAKQIRNDDIDFSVLQSLRMLFDEDKEPVIVMTDGDGFECTYAITGSKNQMTTKKVIVASGHPAYSLVKERTALLDVAGLETSVDGIGETYNTGVYSLALSKDEMKLLEN